MKVPVVLPLVEVRVDDDGTVDATLDGEPLAADRPLTRRSVRARLAEIAAECGTAVRVEVLEADGSSFADLVIPGEPVGRMEPSQPVTHADLPGIAGTGFRPGEDVAIVYVVSRLVADDEGTTRVRLPAATLATADGRLMMIGLASGVATDLETTA